MATTVVPTTPPTVRVPAFSHPQLEPVNRVSNGSAAVTTPVERDLLGRAGTIGLIGLRLALGFEFLWAFLDKAFGLGYATPVARAWVNGGSPTSGFLSHAGAGPVAGVFSSMSGVAAVDWLFMAALLGIGLTLMLGVGVRIGALSGGILLALMYLAIWVPASIVAGKPTTAPNPAIDDHITGIFGLVIVAALATRGTGILGRTWRSLPLVKNHAALV